MKRKTLYLILVIFIITFSLRFYNASDLSGGDDSQLAQLATYAIQDPSKILYPAFPDEPISWQNLHYARPLTAFAYATSVFFIGYNKYAIIFPGTLFAAFSAILLYLIVRKQFNETVAYLATALFVFSPFLLAFTRIGLLHTQIIFFSLLAFYLLFRYLDTKKIYLIYLSTLCWLMIAWTVEIRGLVTAFALVYIIYKNYKDKELIKHLIISVVLVSCIYIGYLLIPLIFFNDPSYLDNLLRMLGSAVGNVESEAYLPLIPAILELGKLLFLTPFMCFIIVPVIFGVIKLIKERKLFWLFYLAPVVLFYIQGQVVPGRQLIFLPAFCALAMYGLIWALEKPYIFSLQFLSTLAFLSFVVYIFPTIFPAEWAAIVSLLPILAFIPNYIVFISLMLFFLTHFLNWNYEAFKAKNLAPVFVACILLLNIFFCIAAATFGVGIYKRTDATGTIGTYLAEHQSDEEYSCVAGIHDKSFTFYTQKTCVFYYRLDLDWLKAQAKAGNIRYFVINLHYYEGTPGLGIFNLDGTLDISNDETSEWHRNHYDKYEWIMNNTIDVTPLTGLSQANPYYRLYEWRI